VRSVILTGDEAGGAFSAGGQPPGIATPTTPAPRRGLHQARRPLRAIFPSNLVSDFPKPVIAARQRLCHRHRLHYHFPAADLIVASEAGGVATAAGCPRHPAELWRARRGWPGIIGKGSAMRVAMGFPLKARRGPSHRARPVGLVPHAALMDQGAPRSPTTIAGLPPLAVRMVKESMNRGQDIPNIADGLAGRCLPASWCWR